VPFAVSTIFLGAKHVQVSPLFRSQPRLELGYAAQAAIDATSSVDHVVGSTLHLPERKAFQILDFDS